MNKMNDPIENTIGAFRAGMSDARTEDPKTKAQLQPWAKDVLYFCLAVVLAVGGLGLYVQITQ